MTGLSRGFPRSDTWPRHCDGSSGAVGGCGPRRRCWWRWSPCRRSGGPCNWSACPTSATRSTSTAFRSLTVPDDRNAYVLYRQASDVLKPASLAMPAATFDLDDPLVDDRSGVPPLGGGESRGDGPLSPRERAARCDPHEPPSMILRLNGSPHAWCHFSCWHYLEASRLEERGDMEGAWGWYRAALRATTHMGLRGTADARMDAQFWHGQLALRLGGVGQRSADDPRPGTPGPRRGHRLRHSPAFRVVHAQGRVPAHGVPAQRSGRRGPSSSHREAECPVSVRWRTNWTRIRSGRSPPPGRSWRREPERSRRVIRLAVANWLAYDDLPPDRRPKSDLDVNGSLEFYAFGPEAPGHGQIACRRRPWTVG